MAPDARRFFYTRITRLHLKKREKCLRQPPESRKQPKKSQKKTAENSRKQCKYRSLVGVHPCIYPYTPVYTLLYHAELARGYGCGSAGSQNGPYRQATDKGSRNKVILPKSAAYSVSNLKCTSFGHVYIQPCNQGDYVLDREHLGPGMLPDSVVVRR